MILVILSIAVVLLFNESRTAGVVGYTLKLIVVDPSGAPIPDAEVLGKRTLADGQCEVRLDPGRSHVIHVRHASYGPAELYIDENSSDRQALVRLFPGVPVEVRVLDARTRHPAVGAQVSLVAESWATDVPLERVARTDETGTARWSQVVPGMVYLQLAQGNHDEEWYRDEDWYRFELSNEVPPLPIVLLRESRPDGTHESPREIDSSPDGADAEDLGGAQDAKISGHCAVPQPVDVWIDGCEHRRAHTTKSGRFVYRGKLDEGMHRLSFRRPGPFQVTHTLTGVRAGDRNVVLRFPPSGDLVVRCLDPHGNHVCKALAAIQTENETFDAAYVEASSGSLRFSTLPVGRHKLWLGQRGYEPLGPVPFVIEPGKQVEVNLRFRRVLPVLAVSVRDAEGRPLSKRRVEILDSGGKEIRHFPPQLHRIDYVFVFGPWTASDGRCFLPVPQVGEVTVKVHARVHGVGSETIARRRVLIPSEGLVRLNLVEHRVLVARAVVSGSAAHKAGLLTGDMIVEWAGRPPGTRSECRVGGRSVLITVKRKGSTIKLRLPPYATGFKVAWESVAY